MVNGLTRLTGEARLVLKELRYEMLKKTNKEMSLKKIGSFLIVEGSKHKDIIKKLYQK